VDKWTTEQAKVIEKAKQNFSDSIQVDLQNHFGVQTNPHDLVAAHENCVHWCYLKPALEKGAKDEWANARDKLAKVAKLVTSPLDPESLGDTIGEGVSDLISN
jgi:hypothetical protein